MRCTLQTGINALLAALGETCPRLFLLLPEVPKTGLKRFWSALSSSSSWVTDTYDLYFMCECGATDGVTACSPMQCIKVTEVKGLVRKPCRR